MKNILYQSALLLLFHFLLVGTQASMLTAQTDIPGGDVSGTWVLGGSPYMVHGEITIPDGQTLTIEPGVVVIFTQHEKFIVQGRLLAVGAEDAMITFTAENPVTGWHGLRFLDIPATNDTSKLVYCKVERGLANGADVEDKTGGGIGIKGVDKLLIARCEITSNKTIGGLDSGGGGIMVSNCSPVITQNLIANNRAEWGHGGGIFIYDNANPVVTNNIISNNIAAGGGGLAVGECNPVLINNTIFENNAEHGGGVDVFWGSPTFINTILYGNAATIGNEVHLYSDYSANFLYSVVSGGIEAFAHDGLPGCPGCNGLFENNIDVDPEFADFAGVFQLTPTSPCISAGIGQVEVNGTWYYAPTTDFYGQPSPQPVGSMPDIGAVEHELGEVVGVRQLESQKLGLLLQTYPNPSNGEIQIPYNLRHSGQVRLEILNLAGERIAVLDESYRAPGDYSVSWNTTAMPTGIYICTLTVDGAVDAKEIIVQR